MTSYIIAAIVAATMILLCAAISNLIQYEGGSNPKDPRKRKIWFWIIAIINPVVFFLLAAYVLAPNPADDQMVFDDYMKVVPIALCIGFVLYIILGFTLSRIFRNGKLGNWF